MTPAVERAREALGLLDEVLASRPHKDDHKLSHATLALCEYRDTLINSGPPTGAPERQRLGHVNAVLSVIAAMHFPLGELPWEELEKARDWLAALVPGTAPA